MLATLVVVDSIVSKLELLTTTINEMQVHMSRKFDLIIHSGTAVDPRSGSITHADIGVSQGKITEIRSELDRSRAERLIDATGKMVLPGIVDSHVHMDKRFPQLPRSEAHANLAAAGVTTAVEFANFRQVAEEWKDSCAGITVLGLQLLPPFEGQASENAISETLDKMLAHGAVGVKILGGHYPNTPETTARAISLAVNKGMYVGVHSGTTAHGSDLRGMEETLELADGNPVHLAHTNAYLRGATDDLTAENLRALSLLRAHPNAVSESHLAPLNMSYGNVKDGELADQIPRNCLRLEGYEPTPEGLRQAVTDGRAYVHSPGHKNLATGPEALVLLDELEKPLVSFQVNKRLTAHMQAGARVSPDGETVFEGPGEFIVDAISSDGGSWRNVIIDQGLLLIEFGVMSWVEFARKSSLRPAEMFGLTSKGAIEEGWDADLVVVDTEHRTAAATVAAGEVIAVDGKSIVEGGGLVLTTDAGKDYLQEKGIPAEVLDLSESAFFRGRP